MNSLLIFFPVSIKSFSYIWFSIFKKNFKCKNNSHLSLIYAVNIFSLLSIAFWIYVVLPCKIFIFMEVCYFFFHCLWIVNCRKPSPIIKVKREFMFSFTICIVSSSSFFFTPTFISLIQLGFTLVYSVKYEYNFIDFIQMASSLF